MFGLAKQLSEAFGETVAARLPQGGAETGDGRHGAAMRWRAVACVALGATAVVCSAIAAAAPAPPPPACAARAGVVVPFGAQLRRRRRAGAAAHPRLWGSTRR